MIQKRQNSGATLVEVLIYMFLGVIVIGFALNSMGTISRGYVRERSVTKMQKDGRDAVQVMSRDIANTGRKFYIDVFSANVRNDFDGDGTYRNETITLSMTRPSPVIQTYYSDYSSATKSPVALSDDKWWYHASYFGAMNSGGNANNLPRDTAASFSFIPGDPFDELTTLRMRMRDPQTPLDVVQITYKVIDNTLKRIERRALPEDLSPTSDYTSHLDAYENIWKVGSKNDLAKPDTVEILNNVAALQFQFSPTGKRGEWSDLPNDPSNPQNNAENLRDSQKVLRILLLVSSQRDVQSVASPSQVVGDVTIPAEPNTLFRLYEKVVEIPNNGILTLPN